MRKDFNSHAEVGAAGFNAELPQEPIYWRVEGSLLNLSAVRPVAFFTWNSQTFVERWARRGALAISAVVRPFCYATHRVFATRFLHVLLRGITRDRLDLLGEEYFQYRLKPRLKPAGAAKLQELLAQGVPVVLVSQALDHVMIPLAAHFGIQWLIANRLEFRNGIATGRLLRPVIRPRGGLARLTGGGSDGRNSPQTLSRRLGFPAESGTLKAAITPARRGFVQESPNLVFFDAQKRLDFLSPSRSLAGRHILLIGSTGFIGKVFLAMLLSKLPEIGKVHLLIRRQRSTSSLRRFEKIVAESPLFENLHARYGEGLGRFLAERIEVVEGDVTRPDLGMAPEVAGRLAEKLDLIINSSGLTDFNPDLATALSTNVDATLHTLQFLRRCRNAALLHLSTCYVVGSRDGRVAETLQPDYTPNHIPGFDAQQEYESLQRLVKQIEQQAKSPEVTADVRRQSLERGNGEAELSGAALDNQIRKNRQRWIRSQLSEVGMRRARELGWPNTYTLTKSLSESMIARLGSDFPIAVVRPSIVESTTHEPFTGWNEGVNTSAPISYLLGTYFRQLPTNERKCLDLIPVDAVCRGMILIAAALVDRRHQRLYQLATSSVNPCDMGRSIELTSLAHRKHYRAQEGLEFWIRARFETIPVSKARYQKLSAPRQRAILRALQQSGRLLRNARSLARKERGLDRVEKLIELYEPFILHNEQVFEAENVEFLSAALPPEEREDFAYDTRAVDWWDYWINIHVPALRRWSYPLIEGRPLEPYRSRSFKMPSTEPGGMPSAETSSGTTRPVATK